MKSVLWGSIFIASPALAEVSDKMPSIEAIILSGIIIGLLAFLVGLWRWWLSVLAIPIGVLYLLGLVSLWNEYHMREALLAEQGWWYFGALGIESLFIFVGASIGVYVGRKRKVPNKTINTPASRLGQ